MEFEDEPPQHAESARVEQQLAMPDAIMEPSIMDVLGRFVEAKGEPEVAIQLISEGYHGFAQVAGLAIRLCADAGVSVDDVEGVIWAHLEDKVREHFDAAAVDSVLDEGQVPEWLDTLLAMPRGRALVESLSEAHKGCMLLNFASRRIVEMDAAGRAGDAVRLEESPSDFCRALAPAVGAFLRDDRADEALAEVQRICLASEVCCAYGLAVLHALARAHPPIEALREAVEAAAAQRHGRPAAAMAVALRGAAARSDLAGAVVSCICPGAEALVADVLALHSVLSADGTTIQAVVGGTATGDCLRHAGLLDALVAVLFSPGGRVPYAYRAQHIAVLAYAVVAARAGMAGEAQPPEGYAALHARLVASITLAQRICADNPMGADLVTACARLRDMAREEAAIGLGAMAWIVGTVSDKSLAQTRCTGPTMHAFLDLLDDIAAAHAQLRGRATAATCTALGTILRHDTLEAVTKVQVMHRLTDSLLSHCLHGEAVVIIDAVCDSAAVQDLATLRYFVAELAAMVAPPLAVSFAEACVRLCSIDRVAEALKTADAATHRAVVDLVGVVNAMEQVPLTDACVALHDGLLHGLRAGLSATK